MKGNKNDNHKVLTFKKRNNIKKYKKKEAIY